MILTDLIFDALIIIVCRTYCGTSCAVEPLVCVNVFHNYARRRDSAEDFSQLNALLCTARDWIFIPAYCFATPRQVGVQISGRPNMKYFAVESCEQCTGSNETNTPSVDSSLSGDPNTTVLCLGRDFVRPGNAPNPPVPHPQPAPGANRAKPGFKYCTVTIEYADLPDGPFLLHFL